MKIQNIIAIFFLLMGGVSPAQTPDHLQLFLLIGQSNMAGRGDLDPTETADPKIFCFDRGYHWVPALDPLHFDKPKMVGVGPGLSFAQNVLKSDPNAEIGLIPCAMGGSSLDQWAPGSSLYQNAVYRAKAASKQGTLAGILWHQGESDSKHELVSSYPARFLAMITQLRHDLKAENVPVIMGELGRFRTNNASVEFNAALPAIAGQVPLCAYVTSENLTDRGDHLHFNTASARVLGERYAAAYLKLKAAIASGTAPAATAPVVSAPLIPTTTLSFASMGQMASRSASEIPSSNWSIGGETLDRDYAIYDEYKKYLGPLGAKAIRMQAGWAKTETEKGVYHWEWLDKVVDDAIAQGLHPWLELSYGNPIYPTGGEITIGSAVPTGDAAVAWDAWAKALVNRYKDRVNAWEIWNEPDYSRKSPINDYVALYIRTAEMIRQEAPKSRIYALSMAGVTGYGDKFLAQLQKQDKLNLVDAITFHGYPQNPDDLSTWLALKLIVAKYPQPIELREGETGAPSRRTTGALAAFSWTELSQAKWDLRRMLVYHGNGIAFNLFTISDFLYPNGMNTKGLLKARNDRTVEGPKPSYSAAQNVFSLFDDTLKPTGAIDVKSDPANPLSVFGYVKDGTGLSAVTIWENGKPPAETNALHETDLDLPQMKFDKPVYIDLLSGSVYEIPKENYTQNNGVAHFTKIPVYDSPIVIADLSLIKLVPPPVKN